MAAYRPNPSEAYRQLNFYPPRHKIDEEYIASHERFRGLGPVCGACTRETGGCCSLTVPLLWREADFRLMALGGRAPGVPGRPRGDRGVAEPVAWWPVRSIALTALVLLALGLPAAAFVAGGGHRDPGPSVTPPVTLFMTQHLINGGAVPATPGTAGGASAQPQAATAGARTVRPADGPAGAALGPLKVAITGRSRGQGGSLRPARPPSRRDHTGPASRRISRLAASGQRGMPGGG